MEQAQEGVDPASEEEEKEDGAGGDEVGGHAGRLVEEDGVRTGHRQQQDEGAANRESPERKTLPDGLYVRGGGASPGPGASGSARHGGAVRELERLCPSPLFHYRHFFTATFFQGL